MIFIVSGGRGAGKSTLCRRLAAAAAARGLSPGGILGPSQYDPGGARTGIFAEAAASGERRLLAEVSGGAGGEHPPADRPRTGRFVFYDDTFLWALGVLRRDLAAGRSPFFLDEIGPLELDRRKGYFPILEEIRENPPAALVLVVRPDLVRAIREIPCWRAAALFSVPPERPEDEEGFAAEILRAAACPAGKDLPG